MPAYLHRHQPLTGFRDGPIDTAIESYGYDATGNRTSFTNAGGTQAYSYPTDSHRLGAVAGVARGYDAVGNTTAIGAAKEYVHSAADLPPLSHTSRIWVKSVNPRGRTSAR